MRLIVLQQPAKMPSVPALRAEASGQEGEQSRELNLKFSSFYSLSPVHGRWICHILSTPTWQAAT